MKHFTRNSMLGCLAFLTSGVLAVNAQTAGEVKVFISDYQSRVFKVSDNGRYAVGSAIEDGRATYPFVWDIQNNTQMYLRETPDAEDVCKYGDAKDVTDDGNVIAGQYDNLPALYYVDTNEWKMLPLPSDKYVSGWSQKITPDGKYVLGIALEDGGYAGVPCLWEDGKLVDVVLPDKDLFGGNVLLACFDDITADGSTIVGRLSYNAFPFATSAFIYKPATEEFMFIDEERMTAVDPGGNMLDRHIEDMSLSPNGKKLTGIFYESEYIGDPDNYDYWAVSEYYTSFEYDMTTNVFTSYGEDLTEVPMFAVDNDGILYGATPLNFPIRSAVVVKNGVQMDLGTHVAERFGIEDFLSLTGFENSGTITSVSGDGNVIVAMADMAGRNYAIVGNGATGIQAAESAAEMDAFVAGGVLNLRGEIATVKVVDMLGRTVVEQSNPASFINLDNAEGIYLVQLMDAAGRTTVKKVSVK